MQYIKNKFLDKPDKNTLKHIPKYFTNMSIQVMLKLRPKAMVYNISVIPNWIWYLKVKIHNYGK
jgi:hypothetical protein